MLCAAKSKESGAKIVSTIANLRRRSEGRDAIFMYPGWTSFSSPLVIPA